MEKAKNVLNMLSYDLEVESARAPSILDVAFLRGTVTEKMHLKLFK